MRLAGFVGEPVAHLKLHPVIETAHRMTGAARAGSSDAFARDVASFLEERDERDERPNERGQSCD